MLKRVIVVVVAIALVAVAVFAFSGVGAGNEQEFEGGGLRVRAVGVLRDGSEITLSPAGLFDTFSLAFEGQELMGFKWIVEVRADQDLTLMDSTSFMQTNFWSGGNVVNFGVRISSLNPFTKVIPGDKAWHSVIANNAQSTRGYDTFDNTWFWDFDKMGDFDNMLPGDTMTISIMYNIVFSGATSGLITLSRLDTVVFQAGPLAFQVQKSDVGLSA